MKSVLFALQVSLHHFLFPMNGVFWNCRGAGKKRFPGLVRDYVRMYHLNFVAILEPRISGSQADHVVHRIGLGGSIRVEARGFSGGIWCLWNPAAINISVLAREEFCIHLKVNPSTPKEWILTVVYASPQANNRPRLWERLVAFHSSISSPWCLAGDFNSILFEHEKRGGAPFNHQSCQPFQDFISSCNLLDLGFKGPPFTWKRGDLCQRLDRGLSNMAWRDLYPSSQLIHLPIPSSDHCALWLRVQPSQQRARGHSYFKFLSPWIDHPGFKDQVILSWKLSDQWPENIKRLSSNLKEWNANVFGNIFKRKRRLLSRLVGINTVLLQFSNDRLEKLREDLWGEYTSILQQEEAYWYHQAKSKWVQLGDKNTRFFHQATISRRRKNRISALLNDANCWVYDEEGLIQLVEQFYQGLYSSSLQVSSFFECEVGFPEIHNEDLIMLDSPVSIDEVRSALFSMGNYKSPGPDGFHPLFFKSQWDVLGTSIFQFVQRVFQNPLLIREVNQTLISLIPKQEDISKASQFRPIALYNVIYKVVTKVVANRIRPILPYMISQHQSSFIPGRSTVDNILLLQETLHSMALMKGQKGYMVLKLDLEKAYDRLEWSFIESFLERFGLPLQLRSVISACISTASMSINWNGSNTDQFSSTRGLRQGDPISPYLFVLSLERLGHKIQQAVHEGSWKALPFGRQGPKISHLFFADDLVLVAEASMDQVGVIRDILDEFCAASGQKVNLGKSQVFFLDNVGAVQGTRLSGLLGIAETKDLGRYLGVPLLHHRASKQHYSFLLDRMRKKLTSWKASTLSFDGRVTLAQSSLSNIPGYTMQTCSIPMAVCEEAERICRDFIWGSSPTRRKCHLISWEKLCKPKNAGGLGFRSLCTLNMAHMMKLGWQVVANPEKLWVQAMRSKYRCGSQTMPDMVIRSRSSHAWRAII